MATEKELIAKYAKQTGITLSESTTRVNEFIDLIIETTKEDGKCVFGKIGAFKYQDVKATLEREGRNPATGAKTIIAAKPARKKITFSLSKSGKLIGA